MDPILGALRFCFKFVFMTLQFYVVYRIKSIYLQLNKAYSDRCPIVVIMHASFHLLHFIQSHNNSLFLIAVDSVPCCVYSKNISRLWTRLFLVFRSLFPDQSGEAIVFSACWVNFLTIATKHFIVAELTCYRIYGQNSYPPSSPFNLFEMIYILLEQLS